MEARLEEVYVFSKDADYGMIDVYRDQGMPPGLRYAASLTGPWRVFGIYEMANLSELPSLTKVAIGSDTGVVATHGVRCLKKSVYHPVSAFVRIDAGGIDPEEDLDGSGGLLAQIRDIVKDPRFADEEGEAESVMGDFDVLAYAGADGLDGVIDQIRRIRALDAVVTTVSLRVIDYVSTSDSAPDDHRFRPKS